MDNLLHCVIFAFFSTLFWLLFNSRKGFANQCISLEQKEANTVGFCKDDHAFTSVNSTIFLTSANVPKYANVSNCSCTLEIPSTFTKVYVNYIVSTSEEKCGIRILLRIYDDNTVLTCRSQSLNISNLTALEFSNTKAVPTPVCLEISLDTSGTPLGSVMSVNCSINSASTSPIAGETTRNSSFTPEVLVDSTDSPTDGGKSRTNKQNTYVSNTLIGGIAGSTITLLIILSIAFVFVFKRMRQQARKHGKRDKSGCRKNKQTGKSDVVKAFDLNSTDMTPTDADTSITYNVMYNVGTPSNLKGSDNNLHMKAKASDVDDLVITDNEVYNVVISYA